MRTVRLAVIVLMLIAAALRLYGLDKYPLPMHQDELSNAYDAYSIVETGADRSGARIPFVLRAHGEVDYRPALYAWLATVPISVMGFSPTAARLPSAVLGIASLGLLFLFARTLVGPQFALVALALAVLSPWHLTYSRLAHEGAILHGFFVILILWLWQRTAARAYSAGGLIATGLAIGFSSSAYQTTRLVGPLLLLLVAWDVLRFSGRGWRPALIVVASAALGAMPQLYVMVSQPEHFFARLVATVAGSAGESQSPIRSALDGLRLAFGPKLLFWPNMDDSGYLAARLIPAELPFYYLGFLTLARLEPRNRLHRFRWYLLAVFLMGILPAVITAHSASVRAAAALVIFPIWSAAGVVWTVATLAKRGVPQRLSYGIIGVAAAVTLAFTAYMYFGSATVNGMRSNNVLVQIGEHMRGLAPQYDRVYVVDSPAYSALHVAAFSGIHPAEFQRTRKVTVDAKGWDYITSVGKYRFLKPRELDSAIHAVCAASRPSLFVSRTGITGSVPLDSVSWHTEKYYFNALPTPTACR